MRERTLNHVNPDADSRMGGMLNKVDYSALEHFPSTCIRSAALHSSLFWGNGSSCVNTLIENALDIHVISIEARLRRLLGIILDSE